MQENFINFDNLFYHLRSLSVALFSLSLINFTNLQSRMALLILLLCGYLNASAVLIFLGNSYRDILHCEKKPFYLKGLEEDSSIMDAYIMHSVCACPLPILG
jgi:hypothetical protein